MQIPTAAGLRGRLADILNGRGAAQVRLATAKIISPATSGDLRLVCTATKELFTEDKKLFGTEARGKERELTFLAADALNAEPPSDADARRVGGNILAHVHGLEKKEKEVTATQFSPTRKKFLRASCHRSSHRHPDLMVMRGPQSLHF